MINSYVSLSEISKSNIMSLPETSPIESSKLSDNAISFLSAAKSMSFKGCPCSSL